MGVLMIETLLEQKKCLSSLLLKVHKYVTEKFRRRGIRKNRISIVGSYKIIITTRTTTTSASATTTTTTTTDIVIGFFAVIIIIMMTKMITIRKRENWEK